MTGLSRPAGGTFEPFRRAVLEIEEHGEEVVVTTQVWTIEELVVRRQVTERPTVVRDTLRRVAVDVTGIPVAPPQADPDR